MFSAPSTTAPGTAAIAASNPDYRISPDGDNEAWLAAVLLRSIVREREFSTQQPAQSLFGNEIGAHSGSNAKFTSRQTALNCSSVQRTFLAVTSPGRIIGCAQAPNAIKIHHKTGKTIWRPLEDHTEKGNVKFYEPLEEVLSHLARRGVPMILKQSRGGTCTPYTPSEWLNSSRDCAAR